MSRIPAVLVSLAAASTISFAAFEFKPYPGARSEPWLEKYEQEAKASLEKSTPGAELKMWITNDSFEKVHAFYKALGAEHKEFAEPLAQMLSAKAGRKVQVIYVIFDDAANPVESKHYVSIQRPVVPQFEPLEVHDVTAIGLYRIRK